MGIIWQWDHMPLTYLRAKYQMTIWAYLICLRLRRLLNTGCMHKACLLTILTHLLTHLLMEDLPICPSIWPCSNCHCKKAEVGGRGGSPQIHIRRRDFVERQCVQHRSLQRSSDRNSLYTFGLLTGRRRDEIMAKTSQKKREEMVRCNEQLLK